MKKLVTVAYILLYLAQAQVDYTNQGAWGGSCQSGSQQTPINILNPTARTNVEIYYSGALWNNISLDSGTTYFWKYKGQAGQASTVKFRYTTAPTTAGSCQEAVYTAAQFHFHRSSQHTIGGTYYTAEMHIVHAINPEYSYCSNMKGYLVVGVIFNEVSGSVDNRFLADIPITNTGISGRADIGAYLPVWFQGGVYNYEGSLTTPGCDEVVQWVLCKNVQSISTAQKQAFDGMGTPNGSGGFHISNRVIKTNSNTLYSIDAGYIHQMEGEEEEDEVWIPIVFTILGALIVVLVVLLVLMCIKARKCCCQKKGSPKNKQHIPSKDVSEDYRSPEHAANP